MSPSLSFFFFPSLFSHPPVSSPIPIKNLSFPPLTILSLLQGLLPHPKYSSSSSPKRQEERNILHQKKKKMREEAATSEEESHNRRSLQQ